ncbi:Ankyrin repeat PH and SEC7 domain containing secG [Fusarium albosuccineum]|uniref:Ankyrin repeat PH and SEC7 domain containing secG n=1 Tax=Fusarium albosuccineum TaxID=1237068 RepID=A0A8H4P6G3_9HYPO|nr:Ankyrin repeat PH and SEC7 domain containing secG [Fusarium albosuccineum]
MDGLYKTPESLAAITGQPGEELRNWTIVERTIATKITVLPLQNFSEGPVFDRNRAESEKTISLRPLQLAAVYGRTDLLPILLKFSDVDELPEHSGLTALFLSLWFCHLEMADVLFQLGAHPSSCYGVNTLHAAAGRGLIGEITRIVDEYHVEPDVEDTDGATPTIYALTLPLEQAIEVIDLLRDKGARSDLTFGIEGWTYVELARAMDNERLALYLEDDRESTIGPE